MSANIVSKCKRCGKRSDWCTCEDCELVCGTCEQPLVACSCDPSQLYHLCEACLEWALCDQAGPALQYVCISCQKKPVVIFRLEHGGL